MSRKSLPNNTVTFIPDTNGTVTRHYALTYENVYKFAKFLQSTSIQSTYLYNNPSEYIVSLKAYPVNVMLWYYQDLATFYATQGNSGGVDIAVGPFATTDVNTKGYYMGYIGSTGTYNSPVEKNIIKLCTISVTETFNNFMDYTVTKLYLFLPFVGFVTLDTAKYMGKEFTVYASLDFANGSILYSLCYGHAGVNEDIGNLIETFSAEIGVDINLTRSNALDITRNNYFNTFKLLGDTASNMITANANQVKGITGGINTGVNDTTSLMRGMEKHINHGTVGGGRNKLITPTSVLLIEDRANPISVSSEWVKLNGYPLQETRTLSSLTGYTEIGEIHFNPTGSDIYTDEINEIVALLREGVIL